MKPIIFLALTIVSLHADVLTYSDLAGRLTDLEYLATPPAPGERGELASSYDRHSRYDAAADEYVAWDANSDGDCGGAALAPHDSEGRLLMMDVHGPGCIWRIWTATPGAGHVKIYLDGASTPTVDLPWSAFFDGKHAPFTRPNLVYHTGPTDQGEQSGGWNNFTPIPFAKSCRIVAEKGWGLYDHFNYTRFPAGTAVPTFQTPMPAADQAALDRADAILGRCGQDPAGTKSGEVTEQTDVTIAPHARATLADLSGEGAVTGLRIRLAAGDVPTDLEGQRKFFRELAVRFVWDGESDPAVWAPFGDFFGSGSGAVPHRTLPSGLTDDGTWYSYWYMPFTKGAHLGIDNDSDRPVTLHAEVVHAPLTVPGSSLLRFHAKWHRDAFLPERADRAIDWTMLKTEGTGRFVGTQLHIWSPCNGWWGEGDEKFFVDGEKFPSTFGTGSEDYFGYAWGRPDFFARPFHAQTVNEDCHGHVSDSRWHIVDNVPFQKAFEGDIEKYYPNDRPTIYANTAFWYLAPGGTDPYQPAPVGERVGYWLVPVIYHEPQSVECESLPVLGKPAHAPRTEDMTAAAAAIQDLKSDRDWGSNAQLFWPAKAPGEELRLAFEVPKTQVYHLMIHLTYGPGYGIVQFSVDGGAWTHPADLYRTRIRPGGFAWDAGKLTKGRHVLAIRVAGRNAAASGYAVGLDYLKMIPRY